jgi:hypothetical protein
MRPASIRNDSGQHGGDQPVVAVVLTLMVVGTQEVSHG